MCYKINSEIIKLPILCVCVCACAFATLVPHRVREFGQVGQQFSLQADGCQAEAPEQGLGSQAVLLVLTEQH